MAVPERLSGVPSQRLLTVVLPAVRGHLGIRSGELTELARERGLTIPTGEPAARGEEWVALLTELAGVTPLADLDDQPIGLMPVVRDLNDLVEGSVAPVAWWQRLLGGGGRPASSDPRLAQLRTTLLELTDGIALPPELVRPLIGRFNGVLTESATAALATELTDLGRDGWLALGANAVNANVWPTCYDHLLAAAQAARERNLGLLYDSGY